MNFPQAGLHRTDPSPFVEVMPASGSALCVLSTFAGNQFRFAYFPDHCSILVCVILALVIVENGEVGVVRDTCLAAAWF